MTQDEINKELDGILEELIFNGDITINSTGEDIKEILMSVIRQGTFKMEVSEEQWRYYAAYCLQTTVESSLLKKPSPTERVQ
jgi:hypothetical protein